MVATPKEFGHALIAAVAQAEYDEAENGERNLRSDCQENGRIGPFGEPDDQSREIPKTFWHWNIFVILNTLTCVSIVRRAT